VYGLHLNLEANISRYLSIKTNLNITEGKESGGIPLRHAAPLFGTTHLIWEKAKFRTDFYSVYNAAKKADKMPPTESEKPYMYAIDADGKPWSPGWYTLNFKVSYNFTKWVSVNAGVENILDHRYRPYASGIVAAGRNYILSLRVKI
jgi:hemoglobin/transferrin/lactoferrin receptor protein